MCLNHKWNSLQVLLCSFKQMQFLRCYLRRLLDSCFCRLSEKYIHDHSLIWRVSSSTTHKFYSSKLVLPCFYQVCVNTDSYGTYTSSTSCPLLCFCYDVVTLLWLCRHVQAAEREGRPCAAILQQLMKKQVELWWLCEWKSHCENTSNLHKHKNKQLDIWRL